jgi:hypothetical protein
MTADVDHWSSLSRQSHATISASSAMTVKDAIHTLGAQEKISDALRRSLPLLPLEARQQVEALLTPTSIALVAGTLIVWAGSHVIGIGEIADVILLVVGFTVLGTSVSVAPKSCITSRRWRSTRGPSPT